MAPGEITYFDNLRFIHASDQERHTASCLDHEFNGYYGIQFVYGGKIEISVNGNPPEFSDNPVVFFTYPGVRFSYGCPAPEKYRSQAHICFAGERVSSYLSGGLMELRKKDLLIPVKRPYELLKLMRDTITYLRIPNRCQHALAILKLEEVLLYIAAQTDTVPAFNTKYQTQMQELSHKIAFNPLRNWDFEKEAEKMFLSYVHFRHIFKNTVGMSPWNYVLECRLRFAAEQIATTTRRISEIAFETGFNDKFYFSRKFRERFQKSPSEHRRRFGNL